MALRRVAGAVQRAEVGLAKSGRPKASFLLLGPTGVGKTETALALSQFLFGSEEHMVRFDMAEYQEADASSKMLGANKETQGLLGDALDKHPDGGIILFDEIEKAHKDMTTIFLSALDAARITMSTGRTRDLSLWYLIFTSNLGSGDAIKMDNVPYATLERYVINVATDYFRPELFARFQEKIVYNRLPLEIQKDIATRLIIKEIQHIQDVLRKRFNSSSLSVLYEPALVAFLVRKGYNRLLGARPMRDTIERLMGDAVVGWLTAVEPCPEKLQFVIQANELRLNSITPSESSVAPV